MFPYLGDLTNKVHTVIQQDNEFNTHVCVCYLHLHVKLCSSKFSAWIQNLLYPVFQWPVKDQESIPEPTRKIHTNLPQAVTVIKMKTISCTILVHLWTVFILTIETNLLTGYNVMTVMTGTMWSAQG